MPSLRRLLFLVICIPLPLTMWSQQAAAVDSIKNGLAAAKTTEEKIYWMDYLSRTLMNVNPAEAETYGEKLIMLAEESRDRKLMIRAYRANGIRCGFFRGQKTYANRAIGYFEKALAIASQERMDEEIGACGLLLADLYISIPDYQKALNYVSEAATRISSSTNDSLKIELYITKGKVSEATNRKIDALGNYLQALAAAEAIKDNEKNKRRKAELKRNSYLRLSTFYNHIEEYDKAIDYYTLAYKELDNIGDKRVPYQRCIDINALGNLFAAKKNAGMAISYYERSIAMADSLKFSNLKVPGYLSLLNQYLRMKEPGKAMAYMNSPRGQDLVRFLHQFGMTAAVYQAYAAIYTDMDQFDSARFYLAKAIPLFEQKMNENNSVDIYMQAGELYKKTGESDRAIGFYMKAKDIAQKNGFLEILQEAVKQMDTLYEKKGDLLTSRMYNRIYYTYKDSADKLTREKEVAQEEAGYETVRLTRLKAEEAERNRRRNNIQYMSIIFGIIMLFISLVVLGMFKVSAGAIRAIGFFVFLMLFEFIFLVFKKTIYTFTHGEPWKDLLFMIGLAALLVPLHHWLEHRVLHYLTSHNRLTSAGLHIKNKFFRKAKQGEQ
ncbi:MAG TPA: tetratricopeptide repeat protein [Chitinophagaceae bacterium]|nr:tetratricopeptide repeat protein [Chitinophagaceae bacterium]